MPRKIDVSSMRMFEPKPPHYKETRKGLITLLGDKQDRLNAALNELERMTTLMNEKRDALVKAEKLMDIQRLSMEAAAQTIREFQERLEKERQVSADLNTKLVLAEKNLAFSRDLNSEYERRQDTHLRDLRRTADDMREMKDNFVRAVAALLGRE